MDSDEESIQPPNAPEKDGEEDTESGGVSSEQEDGSEKEEKSESEDDEHSHSNSVSSDDSVVLSEEQLQVHDFAHPLLAF